MQALVVLSALLAVFVCVQVATAAGVREKVAAVTKKCASENNISGDKTKIAFNQEIPADEGERCVLECVYKNMGIVEDEKFSQAGSTKLAHLRFQKPEELNIAIRLIDTCSKEVTAKDGEKCSLGRVIRECFVHYGKEVNFFPSAA